MHLWKHLLFQFFLLFAGYELVFSQEELSIHNGANFYVHPAEDITVNLNVTNAGSLGSYAGSVINFNGERWTNKTGGRLNDNSPGGLLGTGGNFRFSGNSSQRLITQANSLTNLSFPNLSIANPQNVILEGSNLEVRNNLLFENGHLILNDRDLLLGLNAVINGYNESRFIVTGTGSTGGTVRRRSNGNNQADMIFPIGTTPGSYTPAALSYAGSPQTIGMRVFESVFDKGSFGMRITQNVLEKSWSVNYSSADPNALTTIRLQHNGREELSDFSGRRSQSFISRYDGLKENWDSGPVTPLENGIISSTGNVQNAYLNTRLSMKGVGVFEFFSKSVSGSSALAGLRIPEGISPNEDGLNDKFVIQNLAPGDKVRIDIYNRWQTLVYRSMDYKNDFMGIGNQNGLFGNVLADGTYYYILYVNSEKPVTGHIIINR